MLFPKNYNLNSDLVNVQLSNARSFRSLIAVKICQSTVPLSYLIHVYRFHKFFGTWKIKTDISASDFILH